MEDKGFVQACRLLGVSEEADRRSVEEAFRARCLLYDEDSLASYSLYSEEERAERMERLRAAYEKVLERLEQEGEPVSESNELEALEEEALPPQEERGSAPDRCLGESTEPHIPRHPDSRNETHSEASHLRQGMPQSEADSPPAEAPEMEATRFEPGTSPGAFLRRCREAQGRSISDLAAETRIGARHLGAFEEDGFSDLKAEVYVRGFVTTYAKALGASPVEDIVEAFLEIFRTSNA